MIIENNKQCFVMLWRKLELTRQLLEREGRRFCVRRILQLWIPGGLPALASITSTCKGLKAPLCMDLNANSRTAFLSSVRPRADLDEAIFMICFKCELRGYEELPDPSIYPRQHREFLRAFVSTYLNIGMRNIDLKALDAAYSVVFPHSTPLNISKKALD